MNTEEMVEVGFYAAYNEADRSDACNRAASDVKEIRAKGFAAAYKYESNAIRSGYAVLRQKELVERIDTPPAHTLELVPGREELNDKRVAYVGDVRVTPGLYRIHWKEGGSSVAAIGMSTSGHWWVAPTNWVKGHCIPLHDPIGASWDDIVRLERLDQGEADA